MATAISPAKKKPEDGLARPDAGLQALGAKAATNAGTAVSSLNNAAKSFALNAAAPLALPAAAGSQIVAGALGVARPQPVAAAPAAPGGAFANVAAATNPANTVAGPLSPAASPLASPSQGAAGSALGGGGSDPPSRVLGSFTGKNGTRQITQGFADANQVSVVGGAPAQGAITPLTRPDVGLSQNDNARISLADSERRGFIGNLDQQIAGIGNVDRRSKRDLLANLLQLKGGAVGQAGTLAGAAGDRALQSQTALANAMLGQEGENARMGVAQAGETRRKRMDLAKPQYLPDASGSVNALSGALARPVLDASGAPLRTVTQDQLRPKDYLDTLTRRQNSIEERLPFTKKEDRALLEAELESIDASIDKLFNPTVDGATASHPDGRKMILRNGQWVPYDAP